MLGRAPLHAVWLNTKMNSVTLKDYTAHDGAAGPDYLYGWIQGRGLETLAVFAEFFETVDSALAAQLDLWGKRLYEALADLQARDGHVYFCYDAGMTPVSWESGTALPQETSTNVWTYSDAFAAKGLTAAAARYDPSRLPHYLHYLETVIESIPQRQFVVNEKLPLTAATLAEQLDDYGPRMILLGACGLLEDIGHADKAAYGKEFVQQVIERHQDTKTGLLRNVANLEAVNAGHAIELVGFALQCQSLREEQETCQRLSEIFVNSFAAGFIGPGIAGSIAADDKSVLDPRCPWWSLPETICAAAQLYYLNPAPQILQIWQAADAAFFRSYWRAEVGIAYQNRSGDEPISDVPATPDLDPGYHTCLSLLTAVKAVAQDELMHHG